MTVYVKVVNNTKCSLNLSTDQTNIESKAMMKLKNQILYKTMLTSDYSQQRCTKMNEPKNWVRACSRIQMRMISKWLPNHYTLYVCVNPLMSKQSELASIPSVWR